LKNGFHHAKEHFDLDFSAFHSAEISGILPFGYRHEKTKREEKNRISIQDVSWPNLSTDVSFSGIDLGRKKIRVNNFGYEKDSEKRISQRERTLSA